MKRVLLLIPSMAGVGGTERMVHSLSALLSRAGFDVAQASFDAPGVQRHFESTTPVHGLGPIPRLPLPLRPLAYALSAWRLRRLKQRLGTQITISNLWGADFISILSGGADRKLALCHINVVGNSTNWLMLRFLPLVAAVYQRFDRVMAVSEPLADELRSLYRLEPGKSGYIDNFIDRPEAESCLPNDGRMRFVWCGRFSSEKNLPGLLHAWAGVASRRPQLQLVLLGDGPLLQDAKQVARELGLAWGADMADSSAQVVFVGRVQNPASFLLGARAMLLSSIAEGLPMVVLEALSLGTPVLASDCMAGGVRKALLGEGTCQPDRAEIQLTPAGCLLPVPDPTLPATLKCWCDAVVLAADDHDQASRWRHGALERAAHFGSAAAMPRWKAVLAFGETNS